MTQEQRSFQETSKVSTNSVKKVVVRQISRISFHGFIYGHTTLHTYLVSLKINLLFLTSNILLIKT